MIEGLQKKTVKRDLRMLKVQLKGLWLFSLACRYCGFLPYLQLSLDVAQAESCTADYPGTGFGCPFCFTRFLVHLNRYSYLLHHIHLVFYSGWSYPAFGILIPNRNIFSSSNLSLPSPSPTTLSFSEYRFNSTFGLHNLVISHET